MKNKNKKTSSSFFIFGLVFLAIFFISDKICLASENDLIITEIMYDPEGNNIGQTDWIELYNPTNKKISLLKSSFGLIDKEKLELAKDGQHYLNCHRIKSDISIAPKQFIILADSTKDFVDHYSSVDKDLIFDTTLDLSSSGDSLHLSADSCQTFFAEFSYQNSWGAKNNGKTLEKINFKKSNSKNNWQESYVLGGTPGKKSSEKPKAEDYDFKISINEIFPAPDKNKNEEEYIELLNKEKKGIQLGGWTLKDGSTSGKYIFPNGTEISEKGYLVVYKKDFGFALNNSGNEFVFLTNPANVVISKLTYNGSKKSFSYSFDGSAWRWTSHPTPGKENIFDKILSGKIILPQKVYKNTYAYFNVKTNKDAQKFIWNFGDGHKSYLKDTKHKYEKTGIYEASLKITGNGEDKTYNFKVKVEKYEAPKIRIISLSANPKGKDSENEWVRIKNKSKRKVNLKNWSIATGWKKLINHPLRENFEIKPGKTKKLTRKTCAFTLTNTKDKIELRSPDGKTVQKIKYNHGEKSIIEDEIYSKNDGSWKWIVPKNKIENTTTNLLFSFTEEDDKRKSEIIISDSEIQADLGKYSLSSDWQKKQKNRLFLAYSSDNINLPENLLTRQPKVLGIQTVKIQGNYYTFTKINNEKHWLIKFLESNWIKINYFLNYLVLKL